MLQENTFPVVTEIQTSDRATAEPVQRVEPNKNDQEPITDHLSDRLLKLLIFIHSQSYLTVFFHFEIIIANLKFTYIKLLFRSKSGTFLYPEEPSFSQLLEWQRVVIANCFHLFIRIPTIHYYWFPRFSLNRFLPVGGGGGGGVGVLSFTGRISKK